MVLRTFRRFATVMIIYCAYTTSAKICAPERRAVRTRTEPRCLSRVRCPVPWPVGLYHPTERFMNNIIYLVGLVVVVMAVLSFIGIH
jgi:hypothetical protein